MIGECLLCEVAVGNIEVTDKSLQKEAQTRAHC